MCVSMVTSKLCNKARDHQVKVSEGRNACGYAGWFVKVSGIGAK